MVEYLVIVVVAAAAAVVLSLAGLFPPLLPAAVDDAAAAHRQVLHSVEMQPLFPVASLPLVRALRRDDVPGNLQTLRNQRVITRQAKK